MKIQIRNKGTFVRAFINTIDGSQEPLEFASLHSMVAYGRPDLGKQWKALVTEVGKYIIEEAPGSKVEEMEELPALDADKSAADSS